MLRLHLPPGPRSDDGSDGGGAAMARALGHELRTPLTRILVKDIIDIESKEGHGTAVTIGLPQAGSLPARPTSTEP